MLQLRSIFMKYMRISCYLIFPVMISVTALAEPLISLILTDKWSGPPRVGEGYADGMAKTFTTGAGTGFENGLSGS